MILVPRETIWPGKLPTNSTGTPRPKLEQLRPYYTIHYTGGGLWLDPDDTPAELRSIQAYAAGANKPWEYNYVIDGQGIVWEYAGDYRAAHSAGENEIAIGVLLLVGFKGKYPAVEYWEAPTEPMIRAVRELRAWLSDSERLALSHLMRQHNQMPAAATICPGPEVVKRWSDLTLPWTTPQPPPTEEPMKYYRNEESRAWNGNTYPPNVIKYVLRDSDGKLRRISGEELTLRGVPMAEWNRPEFGEPVSNAEFAVLGEA